MWTREPTASCARTTGVRFWRSTLAVDHRCTCTPSISTCHDLESQGMFGFVRVIVKVLRVCHTILNETSLIFQHQWRASLRQQKTTD